MQNHVFYVSDKVGLMSDGSGVPCRMRVGGLPPTARAITGREHVNRNADLRRVVRDEFAAGRPSARLH